MTGKDEGREVVVSVDRDQEGEPSDLKIPSSLKVVRRGQHHLLVCCKALVLHRIDSLSVDESLVCKLASAFGFKSFERQMIVELYTVRSLAVIRF